jgi:hypothetical protein
MTSQEHKRLVDIATAFLQEKGFKMPKSRFSFLFEEGLFTEYSLCTDPDLLEKYRTVYGRLRKLSGLKGPINSDQKAEALSQIIDKTWKELGYDVREGLHCRVDVVGINSSKTVAIECGKTPIGIIDLLRKYFDIVIHLPYCHTWSDKEIRSFLEEQFKNQEKVSGKEERRQQLKRTRNAIFSRRVARWLRSRRA